MESWFGTVVYLTLEGGPGLPQTSLGFLVFENIPIT